MPIEIAETNFMGEPGVKGHPLDKKNRTLYGFSIDGELIEIKDRTVPRQSGNWDTLEWAVIHGDTLYLKRVRVGSPELPPEWATHIYRPISF